MGIAHLLAGILNDLVDSADWFDLRYARFQCNQQSLATLHKDGIRIGWTIRRELDDLNETTTLYKGNNNNNQEKMKYREMGIC